MTTITVSDGLGKVSFRLLRIGQLETSINDGPWGGHAPSEYNMTGGESETIRQSLEFIAPLFTDRKPLPSVEVKADDPNKMVEAM